MVLARDVMSGNLVYVAPSDSVTRARSIIRKYGFRVLPVLEEGRLVGVVSRADVLKITSSKTNLDVGGIMDRDLYTIGAYEDLKAAAKKLVSSGKRQLLVVDEGSVVGVLSSLDILTEFIKQKHIPEKASVSEVMSRDIVYCSPEDSVSSIWDKIAKTGFSGMPVVLGKKVVGMVTRMNLLKHRKAGISSEGGRPKSIPVKKVMSTPAITCAKSSTIPEVAEIMVSKRILRVPVTGPKDELVGIADTEDILRAYLNLR